ncbi:uncharacterized protein LOC62_02G003412 [Vanrija pseudolonga]|uniref:VOC domain-containing protein n=1 Tax=Vanrija pseudolonga TaxID=143232 RepID=A0AAF0Y8F3_9TREE|nr:hypothetical protein LOC62_02G003412 [Vanrija pseudolonga]
MLDHIGVQVSNYDTAKAFYTAALAPLGSKLIMEIPREHTGGAGVGGFGSDGKPAFWISDSKKRAAGSNDAHVAFSASSTEQVDAFHAAALAAGATCNGKPGPRPQYHPGYYGAFVTDADGNNVEAVFHGCTGPAA